MKVRTMILLFTLALSGCASIINGSTQQISVHSGHRDAEIYANNIHIGTGTAWTSFKKKEEYILTARKEGCNDATIVAPKSFDATTLLGIFIDLGLISILLVDGAINGAWNQFDQSHYALTPRCAV